MSDTKYNGWTNYETWAVALWLDNEQSSQEWAREAARDAWDDAKDNRSYKGQSQAEMAFCRLAERLKDAHEEWMPDLGSTVWADLLNAALGSVDWYEIAKHYIDELIEEGR